MDLYLHIGPDKTGTTTIQKFLEVNREALAEKGYLVPKSPGLQRHFKLYLYGFDNPKMVKEPAWRNRSETPEAFREAFGADLAREVKESNAKTALLSDEGLFRLGPKEVARVHKLLSGLFDQIYVILYLRRQDEHVLSRYQQIIKTGSTTMTLFEYMRGRHPYYYYSQVLKRWADRFEKPNVRPRLFDKAGFVGGDLLSDYLHAVGLPGPDGFAPVGSQNVGLDAASTEFLRLYKRVYHEKTGKELHPLRQDTKLIQFLEARSGGTKLQMSDRRRQRFMARWEKTNASVARDYFGREDGVLFAEKEATGITKPEAPLSLSDSMEFFFEAWTLSKP
jgi:hypothetical protein